MELVRQWSDEEVPDSRACRSAGGARVEYMLDLAECIGPNPGQVARIRHCLVVCLALPVVLCGCGHRATAEDCGFIVDRYVEVELKALSVTDPAVIDKRTAEMRVALKDDLARCPGKRVNCLLYTSRCV